MGVLSLNPKCPCGLYPHLGGTLTLMRLAQEEVQSSLQVYE